MKQKKATIYHNSRCSTSRKALAMLQEAGYEVHIIEYLKTPPSRETLLKLIQDANLQAADAIRTKEAIFTELGLDSKESTEAQLLEAMLQHPILINRPFVVTEKGTRLARPVEVLQEIL